MYKLKRFVQSALRKFGYELRRTRELTKETPGFILYQYQASDGSFDYQAYRKSQEGGNKDKIDSVWVIEENIAFISSYIKRQIQSPQFGLCHGTRRGMEQEWFRKHLGCNVIGTEISETAESFPHTIQWDFHNTKPEWINSVDFVYSNSFDHSYDPEKCLNAWMSCLKKDGICIIEHSSLHEPKGANSLDPFGAEWVLMPYLIATWGKGRFGVRELLNAPAKSRDVTFLRFIIIQRFEDSIRYSN